jgi:hypothetical protein
MSRSFKGALIGVCVVGIAMASTPSASAKNFPHFQRFSVTTVDSAGTASAQTTVPAPPALPDLRFTWTEVGLGNVDVTYRASAVVTATFGCVKGSDWQKASNKTTVTTPVSAQLSEDKNGRIDGSVDLDTAEVGTAGLYCPRGQVLMALTASITQITLTDVTNNVSMTAADITVNLLS